MGDLRQILVALAKDVQSVAGQVAEVSARLQVLETEPSAQLLMKTPGSTPAAKPSQQREEVPVQPETSAKSSKKTTPDRPNDEVVLRAKEKADTEKVFKKSGYPSNSDTSDSDQDTPGWFGGEKVFGFEKIYDHDEDSAFEGSPKDILRGEGSRKRSSAPAEKEGKRKNSNKRTTIFARSAERTTRSARQLTFQAIQPPYSHIRLNSLTVTAVYTFFADLQIYQEGFGIDLETPTLISSTIQKRIKSKYRLTQYRFNNLSDQALYDCARSYVLPETRLDFIRIMNLAVNFLLPPSYRPAAENFRKFYDALLEYRDTFTRTYEMLADGNEENIPDTKNKPGGLIKCFIDKIPHEYGTRVFQNLPEAKYEKIYTFLRKFYKVVEEHRRYHELARKLMHSFGGTLFEAARKADTKLLNNINPLNFKSDPEPSHEAPRPAEPAHLHQDEEDEQEPFYAGAEDNDEEEGEEAESASFFDDELAAMQGAPSRTQPPQRPQQGPCWTKVNTGKCTKMGCTYLHSGPELIKAREQKIQELLQLQKGHPPKVSVSTHRPK